MKMDDQIKELQEKLRSLYEEHEQAEQVVDFKTLNSDLINRCKKLVENYVNDVLHKNTTVDENGNTVTWIQTRDGKKVVKLVNNEPVMCYFDNSSNTFIKSSTLKNDSLTFPKVCWKIDPKYDKVVTGVQLATTAPDLILGYDVFNINNYKRLLYGYGYADGPGTDTLFSAIILIRGKEQVTDDFIFSDDCDYLEDEEFCRSFSQCPINTEEYVEWTEDLVKIVFEKRKSMGLIPEKIGDLCTEKELNRLSKNIKERIYSLCSRTGYNYINLILDNQNDYLHFPIITDGRFDRFEYNTVYNWIEVEDEIIKLVITVGPRGSSGPKPVHYRLPEFPTKDCTGLYKAGDFIVGTAHQALSAVISVVGEISIDVENNIKSILKKYLNKKIIVHRIDSIPKMMNKIEDEDVLMKIAAALRRMAESDVIYFTKGWENSSEYRMEKEMLTNCITNSKVTAIITENFDNTTLYKKDGSCVII